MDFNTIIETITALLGDLDIMGIVNDILALLGLGA